MEMYGTACNHAKKLITGPDVAGWIAIPGMEQPCPLISPGGNRAGCGGPVYLETAGSWNLASFHTVALARQEQNNLIFNALECYRQPDYWRNHPSVYIVLDNSIYRYNIFSAQETDAAGIAFRLDMEATHSEREFLQSCAEGSVIDTGIVPHINDRILTISACTDGGGPSRWTLHGVLMQKYGRKSSASNQL